jgi:hypothetical protein
MARPLAMTPRLGNWLVRLLRDLAPDRFQMKDFSNASFPPETVAIMKGSLPVLRGAKNRFRNGLDMRGTDGIPCQGVG